MITAAPAVRSPRGSAVFACAGRAPPLAIPMTTTVAERIQHQLLPRVSKPNRYLGNALHAPRKPLAEAAVRVLMAFPDAFEIGLSNIGIRIVHHILNQRSDTAAELCFAPWPDAEADTRRLGIPLSPMESHARAGGFDTLGFSFQYDLKYTNVLGMRDPAGLPLRTVERDARHPLVIAGGAQAFSPEPMAEFIDAFVIGDGEEVTHEIVTLARQAKREGWRRERLLRRLAHVPGVYVPWGYEVVASPD